jgi:outer membrane protein OmpA-like peptidoglycan-associated protein
VHFDFGSAPLLPDSFKELEELYEYLKWKETCRIEVAGQTDNVGQESDNMVFSQKRAESVKAWLVKKGIGSSRVIAKAMGLHRLMRTIVLKKEDNKTEELNWKFYNFFFVE